MHCRRDPVMDVLQHGHGPLRGVRVGVDGLRSRHFDRDFVALARLEFNRVQDFDAVYGPVEFGRLAVNSCQQPAQRRRCRNRKAQSFDFGIRSRETGPGTPKLQCELGNANPLLSGYFTGVLPVALRLLPARSAVFPLALWPCFSTGTWFLHSHPVLFQYSHPAWGCVAYGCGGNGILTLAPCVGCGILD